MSRTPQLIISLSPTGGLTVELPGAMATRRKITLRPGDEAQTIQRILLAQLQDRNEIGLDGAPTQAQVNHWERHQIWPSSSCRFCISEGRAKGQAKRKRHQFIHETNGVTVRQVAEGISTLDTKPRTSPKSAKDLGL